MYVELIEDSNIIIINDENNTEILIENELVSVIEVVEKGDKGDQGNEGPPGDPSIYDEIQSLTLVFNNALI
jgi:hypothetical protein